MTCHKILFVDPINTNSTRYVEFSKRFVCIHYKLTTKKKFIEDLNNKFTDISAIYAGWPGLASIGLCHSLINAFPSSLKIITLSSIGYNHLPLPLLSARGIIVTNAPSPIASSSVADLVLFNTLSSFRNFHLVMKNFENVVVANEKKLVSQNRENNAFSETALDEIASSGLSELLTTNTNNIRESLKFGSFDQESGNPTVSLTLGNSFSDRVFGKPSLSPANSHAVIVGFGSIGQVIGQRLSSIGMHIHYVKRSKLSLDEELALGYKATYHKSLIDTASFADLIIIACPGGPETKHLINKEQIDLMEKPFRVINIGRGTSIDESALVKGLESGKILFAGLDVFENEPVINPKLLGRHDVILTPHIGSGTMENFEYTMDIALTNIEIVLEGDEGTPTKVN